MVNTIEGHDQGGFVLLIDVAHPARVRDYGRSFDLRGCVALIRCRVLRSAAWRVCGTSTANFFPANSLSCPEGSLPNLCSEDLRSSIAKTLPSAHPGPLCPRSSDAVLTKIYQNSNRYITDFPRIQAPLELGHFPLFGWNPRGWFWGTRELKAQKKAKRNLKPDPISQDRTSVQ